MNNILEKLVRQAIHQKIYTEKELHNFKNAFCGKYRITTPKNIDLIEAYRALVKKRGIKPSKTFFELIIKRRVRSLSGIASITVITKEYPCPGKCVFCPKEKGMPKSYLSNEPAIMRAVLNNFDAFKQVRTRMISLEKTGHPTSKIDMIIAGGTFSFYPKSYRTRFVKAIYDALNYPTRCSPQGSTGAIKNCCEATPKKSHNLKEAQKINEKARCRCIGLSIETRPDYVTKNEIKYLRELGVTKVELGIQTVYDDVLRKNLRGHSVKTSINAIRMLKDAGFKVNCHIMPGLLGSTPKKDLQTFKELFDNPDFRPDWLKIYPCVVVPGSALARIWKNSKYKSYTDEQMINFLVKVKSLIPEYVRITRLYRDIPANSILAGPKISNLREYVQKEMLKKGLKCSCIRCREIKNTAVDPKNLEMRIKEFEASRGREFFLSFDDKKHDKLCSLLRLRLPYKTILPELCGAAIIRELHTYGLQIPVDEKGERVAQHLGLGKKLLVKAEEISRKHGYKKIAVISGIGAKDYYKKNGYKEFGTYMVRGL